MTQFIESPAPLPSCVLGSGIQSSKVLNLDRLSQSLYCWPPIDQDDRFQLENTFSRCHFRYWSCLMDNVIGCSHWRFALDTAVKLSANIGYPCSSNVTNPLSKAASLNADRSRQLSGSSRSLSDEHFAQGMIWDILKRDLSFIPASTQKVWFLLNSSLLSYSYTMSWLNSRSTSVRSRKSRVSC